jgi:hypothetical protein
MLNNEAIEEFKKIYQEEYGIELDDQTARLKAEKLITIMNAIYRPIEKENYQDFCNKLT